MSEKRLTPMQEFKERFFAASRISDFQAPDGRQDEVIDLQVLTDLFDEMLEKEMRSIVDFGWIIAKDANFSFESSISPFSKEEIEQRYNETFKTEKDE